MAIHHTQVASPLIDLHLHTNLSDGTDTPFQLLEKVCAAGMRYFSVTDHDSVGSALTLRPMLRKRSPFFITGVEFSCRDEEGKYHILGYGFDPEHEAVKGMADRAHDLRMSKVAARLEFLASQFGFTFPENEIARLMSLDNPGKPHIGNLMVRHGYAASKESAIHDYIDLCRVKSEYIRPEEAAEAILASGGIPVLAHPFYGSGDELIIGDDMDRRLRRLIGFGLKGVEAFYSGFSEKLRSQALALAAKYSLFATAGSDYHGKNKMVALGDTGLDKNAPYPKALADFLKSVVPLNR